MIIIGRTGRIVPFNQISIGSPFFYMEKFWVRTDYTAGTELHSTNVSQRTQQGLSSCSFMDGDDHPDNWITVEEVVISTDLGKMSSKELDPYEIANQLYGYIDMGTPNDLMEFLQRVGQIAAIQGEELSLLRLKVSLTST